jgi:hypothetical protein
LIAQPRAGLSAKLEEVKGVVVSENQEMTNQVEVAALSGEDATGGEFEQVVGGSRRPLILGTVISVLVIGAVAATLMFAFGGSRSNHELKKATNDSFVVEYNGAKALLTATNSCTNYQCVNVAAKSAYAAQLGAIDKLGGGFPGKLQKMYDTYRGDLAAIADTYKSLETVKSKTIVAQYYSMWQTQFKGSARDGYLLLNAIGK